MSEAFKTHILLNIGEILQLNLPGFSEAKLINNQLLCTTDDRLANVVIEIKIHEEAGDFGEAETLADPRVFK